MYHFAPKNEPKVLTNSCGDREVFFDTIYTYQRGKKLYEGSNHLGNVLTTFSDKRLSECLSDTIFRYMADVRSQTDYSAFHVMLDDRQWYSTTDSNEYRFGINGQERDDEIYGAGNSYTAEYWQYDPRLGRRWNVDPVVKPWESPYASFYNSPTSIVDIKGDDGDPPKAADAQVSVPEAITFGNEVLIQIEPVSWWQGFKEKVFTFGMGIINAWGSNQVLGAGRITEPYEGPNRKAFKYGQRVGDIISLGTGIGELIVGAGGEAGAAALASTGIGAPAAVPVAIASTGAVVHGATVVSAAAISLIEGITDDGHYNDDEKAKSENGVSEADKGTSINRLHHIFGKPEHALENLVAKFGSQEAAYNAVQNAANQALKAGKLTPNAQGVLPKVGEVLNVGGMNVRLIGGKVENGRVIISSFSRKGL